MKEIRTSEIGRIKRATIVINGLILSIISTPISVVTEVIIWVAVWLRL